MIIAYSGVQADEADRPDPRLPEGAEPELIVRLRGLFNALRPRLVVGALASGSDLLIAEQALHEGRELRIFLPFGATAFRGTSVTQRGVRWEVKYDRLISELGDKIRFGTLDPTSDDSYRQHNSDLLDYADELAGPGERIWALIVRPAKGDAATVSDDFAERAEMRGMLTLDLRPVRPTGVAHRRGFVAMSYGQKFDPNTKKTYDCDPVFEKVYLPVLEDLDVDWTRADLQTDSGLIHVAMINDLANSDLVIADLATSNFNVAYELGLRHVFAPNSTVLVNPVLAGHGHPAPPFDVGLVRTVSFERGIDLTDAQAETAISKLRPVLAQVLARDKFDSPVHEWFEFDVIKTPLRTRVDGPGARAHEIQVRERVKRAIRSSSAQEMTAAAEELATENDLAGDTVTGLRLELGSALLDEGAYSAAAGILTPSRPAVDNPLHRVWLQKMAMAYRRIGDCVDDAADRDRNWSRAEELLKQSIELGYVDSETYGIYGGLVKQRLRVAAGRLDERAVNSQLRLMRGLYRKGWEAEPTYYTGVNVVMASRIILGRSKRKDNAVDELLREALTVSRFLARVSMADDAQNFWAAATEAELLLHEALMTEGSDVSGAIDSTDHVEDAASAYSAAGLLGRPEHLRSAKNQLEFLRAMGDPDSIIDEMLAALDPSAC